MFLRELSLSDVPPPGSENLAGSARSRARVATLIGELEALPVAKRLALDAEARGYNAELKQKDLHEADGVDYSTGEPATEGQERLFFNDIMQAEPLKLGDESDPCGKAG